MNGDRRRKLVMVVLVWGFVLASACTRGESECETDGDCPSDAQCVSNGAVLFAERLCIPVEAQGADTDGAADGADGMGVGDSGPSPEVSDGGDNDGRAGDVEGGDAGPPSIQFEGFGYEWATANTILWTWTPRGSRPDFFGYRIVVAKERADLEQVDDLGPTARTFDEETNPELGYFALPRTGDKNDLTDAALTRGLDSGEKYFARLIATDTSLRRHVSPIVAGSTTASPVDVVGIYREDPKGYRIPSDAFEEASIAPHEGSDHMRYEGSADPNCSAEEATCFQNLRIQDMGIDATGGEMSPGDFLNTAFLEMAIANSAESPVYWSEVWLWFDGCSEAHQYTMRGLTIPATGDVSDYIILQIPLAALVERERDRSLTYETLRDRRLCGVNVGGEWRREAPVHVDEIVIRY